MRALVVANDFPPKHGGIQSYHRELWRRLPADEVVVLTTPHPNAAEHDAAVDFRVERVADRVLLPTPPMATRVRALYEESGADVLVFDPCLPIGLLGPRLDLPYAVIIHGGVVVRASLPGVRRVLASVLRGASAILSAGDFPASVARGVVGEALPPVTVVPPGVDVDRFVPAGRAEIEATRRRLDLPVEGRIVVSVSRLVPRKGMDTLIEAAALLGEGRPDLVVVIGGGGSDRERARLDRLVTRTGAPVRLLGRVDDEELPALYAAADVFAMLCRDAGLVKEGFGVVFAEAAASGVPQVAGNSGGAADAVVDGVTGLVVEDASDPVETAAALARLLDQPELRRTMGEASRTRAVAELGFDHLAARVRDALHAAVA